MNPLFGVAFPSSLVVLIQDKLVLQDENTTQTAMNVSS